jgi:hypothetical protein
MRWEMPPRLDATRVTPRNSARATQCGFPHIRTVVAAPPPRGRVHPEGGEAARTRILTASRCDYEIRGSGRFRQTTDQVGVGVFSDELPHELR